MGETDLLKRLKEAIINYDTEEAAKVAKEIVEKGFDPLEAIEKGVSEGLKIVGEKFGAGEIFLPMLMMAAQAAKEALAILEPMLKEGASRKTIGKVVIGTVEGDIHDIGKNIVATMLTANGFEVYDIGVDAPASKFVEKAKEVNPQIIGISALMTTTMQKVPEVIEALKKAGLREKVKVMVGGAAVTEEWAKQIGADGYGEDAKAAVEVAKKLVLERGD